MNGAMRFFTAAALASALLTGPAFAQFQQKKDKQPMEMLDEERKRRNAEADKEYKIMREQTQIEAAKTKVDPWASIRPSDDKTKPKPKPKR